MAFPAKRMKTRKNYKKQLDRSERRSMSPHLSFVYFVTQIVGCGLFFFHLSILNYLLLICASAKRKTTKQKWKSCFTLLAPVDV